MKGRTEDTLLALFPSSYMFRLSALRPMHGEVSKTRWTRISYAVFRPFLPLARAIAPNAVISTEELGRAMIRAGVPGCVQAGAGKPRSSRARGGAMIDVLAAVAKEPTIRASRRPI